MLMRAILTAALATTAAAGAPLIALLPGVVVGEIQPIDAKRGQTVGSIAASHGVHPIRISKPSAKALKDGLATGETLFIDQRRIVPTFAANMDGIVLNLPEAHVYLLEKGRIKADWPVGVSTGESEWRAPVGPSKVREKVKNPTWHIPEKIQAERARKGLPAKTKVAAGPKNPLGTRWIGFGDGTYGFHGTLDPQSIKRYASHGCVRMNNAHVQQLFDRVKVGTPVHVLYQPVMLAADERAIWLAVFPDFYGRKYNYRAAVRSLADRAQVAPRLNSKAIEVALKAKDGVLLDVSAPLAPKKPLPLVTATPAPVASPAS